MARKAVTKRPTRLVARDARQKAGATQSEELLAQKAQIHAESMLAMCHSHSYVCSELRRHYGTSQEDAMVAIKRAMAALTGVRELSLEANRALMVSRLEHLFTAAAEADGDRVRALSLCERILRTMCKVQGLEQIKVEVSATQDARTIPSWAEAMSDEELERFLKGEQ